MQHRVTAVADIFDAIVFDADVAPNPKWNRAVRLLSVRDGGQFAQISQALDGRKPEPG